MSAINMSESNVRDQREAHSPSTEKPQPGLLEKVISQGQELLFNPVFAYSLNQATKTLSKAQREGDNALTAQARALSEFTIEMQRTKIRLEEASSKAAGIGFLFGMAVGGAVGAAIIQGTRNSAVIPA